MSSGLVAPAMWFDEEVDVRAPDHPVVGGRLKMSETLRNLESLFVHLPGSDGCELVAVISKYPTLCSDRPSHTGVRTW